MQRNATQCNAMQCNTYNTIQTHTYKYTYNTNTNTIKLQIQYCTIQYIRTYIIIIQISLSVFRRCVMGFQPIPCSFLDGPRCRMTKERARSERTADGWWLNFRTPWSGQIWESRLRSGWILWSMVDITIVNGVYKPTYNFAGTILWSIWGFIWDMVCQFF